MSDVLRKLSERARVAVDSSKQDRSGRPVILAVGEIRLWRTAGRILENSSDMAFAEYQDLTPEVLDLIAPDVVLSPLLTRSFDCLDLAVMLHEAGFLGRYRIVSSAIANPTLILSEIAASCPGLDVSIVELDNAREPQFH